MNKILVLAAWMPVALLAESVPSAKVTPVVNATPSAHAFLAASHNLTPMDLSKAGYVEEEFIVSGKANVYDWPADGQLAIKMPSVPYASRVLVRRPADPAKFSGTVVVELPNTARRADWAMMWGYLQEYMIGHGDAWVGVTLPGGLDGVKKFDPVRYSELSFASPGGSCGPNNTQAAMEDGMRFDFLSQVARALKEKLVMPSLNVQKVFMTTQGGDIVTYINAIQPGTKLYDGFLIKGPAAPARINSCAAAIPRGDARLPVHDVGVPVIQVVPQGEVADSAANRREDSDSYRLYEIAAAAHIDKIAYLGMASVNDQNRTGTTAQGTPDWPFNARCEPEISLSTHPLLTYMFHMALANLDAWSRGTAAPKASRIALKDGGALDLDQFGIAKGGIRSPYADVPTASYFTTTPGPGTCRELGYDVPVNWQKLESIYGNYSNYAAKVGQSADQLVKDRWLTESDAKKIRSSVNVTAGMSNPRSITVQIQ
jgi:Alpha/beta hydrolase domain